MKTQKERMLSGELYLANDKELLLESKRAKKLIREINATTEEEIEKRQAKIKELFGQTGQEFYLEPPFYCDYGSNIKIGNNFYANSDCIMLDVASINIGDNVMFGPRVNLFTATHPIDAKTRVSGPELGYDIKINDNVWIGGGSIINPGIEIGENTIIGSGSVVTKNIPSNVIAAGNPCRIIRKITNDDEKKWSELHKQLLNEVNELENG